MSKDDIVLELYEDFEIVIASGICFDIEQVIFEVAIQTVQEYLTSLMRDDVRMKDWLPKQKY